MVDGEHHDPILLGFVGSYKRSVGNHQFSRPRYPPRPARKWERRKLLYAGKDSQRYFLSDIRTVRKRNIVVGLLQVAYGLFRPIDHQLARRVRFLSRLTTSS